jgi:hypothetical protein
MDPQAELKSQPDRSSGLSVNKKEHRVFINDRGEATFICTVCDKGVIRDLSDFIHTRSAVRLKCKCSCGNVYRVLVERRRHFRKPVNLLGMFFFRGRQRRACERVD